jgi:hypothetical protein
MQYPSSAGQRLVRSLVVRIYRSTSECLSGTVEDVESGASMPFDSMEALWHALREADACPPVVVTTRSPG